MHGWYLQNFENGVLSWGMTINTTELPTKTKGKDMIIIRSFYIK